MCLLLLLLLQAVRVPAWARACCAVCCEAQGAVRQQRRGVCQQREGLHGPDR
jgi:hypothetical protein